MISNIEAELQERYALAEQNIQQPWAFQQKEGDIRCIAHVINIAVQSALKEIKAVPAEDPEVYRQEENQASISIRDTTVIMTALEKLRKHIYIFRNRRVWKNALKSQLIAFNIKVKVLKLDMPVHWNSTYEMLATALEQRLAINAVCITQEFDPSVKDISLSDEDCHLLESIAPFFKVFVSTSVKMQSSSHPTLNEVIPRYHLLIKNVTEQLQKYPSGSISSKACLTSLGKLREYYIGTAINYSYAGIATVCDLRFKLNVFNKLIPPSSLTTFKKTVEMQFIACYIKYQRRQRDIEMRELEVQVASEAVIEIQDSIHLDSGSDDQLFSSEVLAFEHEWTRYLSQPVAPQVTNIYDYWKVKQYEFPIIARISRDSSLCQLH